MNQGEAFAALQEYTGSPYPQVKDVTNAFFNTACGLKLTPELKAGIFLELFDILSAVSTMSLEKTEQRIREVTKENKCSESECGHCRKFRRVVEAMFVIHVDTHCIDLTISNDEIRAMGMNDEEAQKILQFYFKNIEEPSPADLFRVLSFWICEKVVHKFVRCALRSSNARHNEEDQSFFFPPVSLNGALAKVRFTKFIAALCYSL